ncbi:phosphoglycerate dehydrogenase [Pseudalkalibacillus decolorationis]|uniref:phosphoglycerate dehydrogenase n=1 Tax=Pseudalkalibacillus decolorationis TaxID=163879 RepID=UPI002147E8F4|nr:phosphoglycerate dehydrogenase [Pseudalkalibacillus decolorationis]
MFNILVSDPLSNSGIQALLNADDVHVDQKTDMDEAELIKVIPNYDALLVRSQTKVNSDVLRAATNLKVIGRAGVGVDNIDIAAATEKGILVVNAPDGNTISAAEHAMAMMMSLARNIPRAYQSMVAGEWNRTAFRGVELNKKTLGIIGMGRIGTEVSYRAKGFQMHVIAFDPFLSEERAKKLGVEKGSVEDVVKVADFITVHTPLTKETHHLLSTDEFNLMRPGVRLINCARGGIIDEQALYKAIHEGKVAGAALDVFETEPPINNPLVTLPQVIVTPHLGASTEEAQELVARDVSEEVLHILNNKAFKNAVNLPAMSSETMAKLEPYSLLGTKLGEMIIQITEGTPEDIQITYSGELTELDTAHLTRMILKGMLSYHLGSQVNLVNATHLAKAHGLSYTVKNSAHDRGFTSLINVSIKTENQERSVSGTLLNGYGPRIIKIDDYTIDISPEDHLLLIHHIDRPGLIGHVGSVLGETAINIGSMQVARQNIGGRAIMMLSIDKKAEESVVEKLEQIQDIISVKEIEIVSR